MTIITEVGNAGFVRPSAREMAALHRVATKLAPALGPGKSDTSDHYAAFGDTFLAIGTSMSRTRDDLPDHGKSLTWYTDQLSHWCRSHGGGASTILPSHLVLACLAHGNVSHTFDPTRWPLTVRSETRVGRWRDIR